MGSVLTLGATDEGQDLSRAQNRRVFHRCGRTSPALPCTGERRRGRVQVVATSGVEHRRPSWWVSGTYSLGALVRDAEVIAAYRQLQVETDDLFSLLTRHTLHRRSEWCSRVAPVLMKAMKSSSSGTFERDARGHLCRHCRGAPSPPARLWFRRRLRSFSCGSRPHRSCLVRIRLGSLNGQSASLERSRPPLRLSRSNGPCYRRMLRSERRPASPARRPISEHCYSSHRSCGICLSVT